MNNYELTEEERRPLLDICDKWLDYEIEDHINKLLKDRYERWIKSMQEKLCNKCGRFHSEWDMCEELLPF